VLVSLANHCSVSHGLRRNRLEIKGPAQPGVEQDYRHSETQKGQMREHRKRRGVRHTPWHCGLWLALG